MKKIIIGISIFIIFLKTVLFIAIQQTTAFESAGNFIKSSSVIQNKVGFVNGIFLVPFGGISMSTGSKGSAGEADLHFIVKGSKKYIDLNILLNKDFDTDWRIQINE